MELQAMTEYQFDNAKLSICRHFRDKTSSEDVIKDAVIKHSKESELLTAAYIDDKIQMCLREPLCQIRRSDKQE